MIIQKETLDENWTVDLILQYQFDSSDITNQLNNINS